MTSKKKIDANRQNAVRSTGPRTRDGKRRVAQNAIRHGLLSRETLVPGEDPKALESSAEATRTRWDPQGPQEEFQVDLLIRAMWRLERLARVEAGIFARKHYWILAERAVDEARMCKVEAAEAMIENAQQIADPEGYHQAMTRAQQMTARGEEDSPTVGLTFIRGSSGADVFSKFHRYEAGVDRSYYRALHELERLQRTRLGEYVPPPLALDVTVNGGTDNTRPQGASDVNAEEDASPRGDSTERPKRILAKQTQTANRSAKLDSHRWSPADGSGPERSGPVGLAARPCRRCLFCAPRVH